MTIAALSDMAAADAAETRDAQRMMAGAYGQKALRALRSHDWAGATDALIRAATRRAEYAAALSLVEAARRGAATSAAKAAASRTNGKKGGRPKRSPEGDQRRD